MVAYGGGGVACIYFLEFSGIFGIVLDGATVNS
jgi:hypothetical protein